MKSQQALGPAVIGAIGVVFGDIGTSPLYTLQRLSSAHFGPGDAANVLGLLSLIFWVAAILVTVKYIGVIMRADNAGEGGILALVALVAAAPAPRTPWVRNVAIALGVSRHRAVLLRRPDHAGDLGAVRGRGPGSPRSRPSAVRWCRSRSW